MKIKILRITVFLLAMASVVSCASRGNMIVLLPDADGQVGRIEVETKSGTTAVDQPYHAIRPQSDAPEDTPAARSIDPAKVHRRFKYALAMEPEQRFRFEKEILYCLKDSVALTAESQAALPALIERLRQKEPVEIYLVGHADRVGTERYNRQLSERRAVTLQQKLMAGGINSKIILVSFLGESNPRIATSDEVEEPRNRCVAVIARHAKLKPYADTKK